MTHETDFLELYRRLGLSPGCELSELKRAYRRQVALWHPDRQEGGVPDARVSLRLQRLTAQYGAAMEFHRRHGRLPGAPAQARVPTNESTAMVQAPFDPFTLRQAAKPLESFHLPETPLPTSRNRQRGRLAAGLAVIALGTLAWSLHQATGQASRVPDDAPAAPVSATQTRGEATAGPRLRAGMSSADVRAMEGDPVAVHGDVWEYGPSWVRFDHGVVVEWHSSPLRALHTGETAMGHDMP